MSENGASATGQISVPNGGGAVKGLGEKFSPDLHTGTGNFSIPINVPAGRGGLQPAVSLTFSTGQGNDIFGLGWKLSLPAVVRKISDGVPLYNEAGKLPHHRRADVFVLSGHEDLVEMEKAALGRTRYKPRTEGLFADIIHDTVNGNQWQIRTKDGLISVYEAVLRDPSNANRIFAWGLKETRGAFGNIIRYEYESRPRSVGSRSWAESLPKAIRYADYENTGQTNYLVSVEFDYENRPDCFSDYRSGFEVRTTQRCKTIRIMVHEQGAVARLSKQYSFGYEQASHNGVSLLTSIEITGENDDGKAVEAFDKPPPLLFGYSELGLKAEHRRFLTVDIEGRSDVPLANPDVDFIDLHGNGLPDILDTGAGYHYWRNLGGGRFDIRNRIDRAPPFKLSDPGVTVLDADGDGRPDLIALHGSAAGRFPLSHDMAWEPVPPQLFSAVPSFSLDDPEVRLLDIDGDGLPDILRTGANFDVFYSERDGRRAWKNLASKRRRSLAEFPNVSFSDPRVRTGDLSGDGLQDILVVHDGAVEFWPNLGHGEWAPMQLIPIEPRLPRDFDPKLLLVGDVDGDGLSDLVLADEKGVRVWINQGGKRERGNRFVEYPMQITGTPVPNSTTSLRLIDLNGTGVSGLLWTQSPGGSSRPATLFLDFTTGTKPNLLNRMDNQMGAITSVEYKSSSEFFLTDFQDPSTRWRTPLPFPVQVVSKVVVEDEISGGRLTTQYRYHHGYWDGAEREFRGFGMVETLDTEEIFDPLLKANEHFSPPVRTKTWFHQGPVGPETGDWRELDYTNEYWIGDPQLLDHTSQVNAFLTSLPSRRARRDALRTLRGSILRTELFALDDSTLSDRPYTVTEHAYGLREEVPPNAGSDRLHIFFPHAVAQRTTQWERGDDPMTQFAFTGGYDDYGQPQQQTTVVPPRRKRNHHDTTGVAFGAINLNETRCFAQHTRTDFAEPIGSDDRIFDRPANVRSYECQEPPQGTDTPGDDTATALLKQYEQALDLLGQFAPLSLPAQAALSDPDPTLTKLVGHQVHHYDGNAFEGLDAGNVGKFGALVRTEALVFTDAILNDAYDARRPSYLGGPADIPPHQDFAAFGTDFGYREDSAVPGSYWVDTIRNGYDFQLGAPTPRGLVRNVKDPRGNLTTIEFDHHDLLPVKVIDAAGHEITANYNYRVLQPASVTDPNGTRTHLIYTAIGLPRAQYIESEDLAEGGTEAKPELLHRYGFENFIKRKGPVHVETERRIHHSKSAGAIDETILSREFSDGFGRLVQTRTQAEDIVFGERGDDVGLPAIAGEAVVAAEAAALPDAVIVSGFQEYDQKGRVIRKYEPCFDSGFDYQPDKMPAAAVFVSMFYDPRGQVIRMVNPDSSEQRIIFGVPGAIAAPQLDDPDAFEPTPWESYAYDANDLAPMTHGGLRAPSSHHFTPASTLLDGLGRTIAQIVRNGPTAADDWHITKSAFDLRGNLLSVTDALNRIAFRHSYDLLDRPLKMDSIDAGLRTSVLDALGNLVEYRDSKGSLVLRRYDELNRLCELWARNNDDPNSKFTLREKLTYGTPGEPNHSAGKLIQHCDEAGIVKIDGYDFKGRILEASRQVPKDAEMADWLTDWSPSELTSTTSKLEAKAYVTTTSYDALGRVTTITYPEDVTGGRAMLTPRYNRGGSLKAVDLRKGAGVPNEPFVAHITYNAKGQRVLIAYGNGMMTRHAYDPKTFRLARLRTEAFQKAGDMRWTGLGTATGLNDKILQDYSYQYDLAGNIISIEERVKNCGIRNPDPDLLLRRFDYDPIYRLTKATGRAAANASPGKPYDDPQLSGFHRANAPNFTQENGPDLTEAYLEDYQYDSAGNMLAMGHSQGSARWVRQYAVASGSNRLASIASGGDTFACAYDPNGNLILQAANHHHDWDHGDRMTGYRNQNGSTTTVQARYLYGADGMRVKKWVRRGGSADGEETTTYIGGMFEHHRWLDSGAAKENNHLHVMDNQNRIAMQRIGPAHQDETAPEVQYHLGDHLGSSSLVLGGGDASGFAFVNREEYTSYGETCFGSLGRKRFRFSGKERDEESGLIYFGARYFSSWMARWINCDPRGTIDALNIFIYVRNNPLRLVDPDGRAAIPSKQEHIVQTTDPCLETGCIRNDTRGVIERKVDNFLEHSPSGYMDALEAEAMGKENFTPLGPLRNEHIKYVELLYEYLQSSTDESSSSSDDNSTNGLANSANSDQSIDQNIVSPASSLSPERSISRVAASEPDLSKNTKVGLLSRLSWTRGRLTRALALVASFLNPDPNPGQKLDTPIINPSDDVIKDEAAKRDRDAKTPAKPGTLPPPPRQETSPSGPSPEPNKKKSVSLHKLLRSRANAVGSRTNSNQTRPRRR